MRNAGRYDQNGRLHDWWDKSDVDAFNQRAECLISEYDLYVIDGKHVHGKQTLAENIADNGGVKVCVLVRVCRV